MTDGPRTQLSRQSNAPVSRLLRRLRRVLPADSRTRALLRRIRRLIPGSGPAWYISDFIAAFAHHCPAATFIQIGSNDGRQQDPLREAVRRHHWRGILVEPVPYVFESLRAHHGDNPRLTLENVAIADVSGTKPFYYLRQSDDPSLPRWYDALGSFRREVIESHASRIPDIDQRVETLQVPCMRFDQLCDKHGLDQIDLIHTDVEGYDWTLLQTIDLQRYQPKLFLYEHHHQDAATRRACRQYMQAHGYTLLSEGLDTLAVRLDALPKALTKRFTRYRAALGQATD